MRPLTRPARALARIAMQVDAMPQPPLRPTRYPVVLMHGFGAVAGALPGGALHAEAMHLRARGVWAYAPTVNPYDTVAVRAESWAERLGRVLAETGAERLNLVAFSSGGLDARHLATELGWAERLASIVTVATPHGGTALAQFVLDRPDRLRGWAVGLMDFFGRAAYDADPHAADALVELSPANAAQRFGAETVPGVWCASFASQAGKGTAQAMYPPLVVPNRILYGLAGLNDGIVPAASAVWGEPLGTLDADHARLIGLSLTPSDTFESCAFYLSVCDRLAVKGF